MKVKSLSLAIVVCTFQNAHNIESTIDSIELSTSNFFKRKLFLVDDSSTDETCKKAKKVLKNKNLDFEIIEKDKNLGISHSRNIGISVSSEYELLTFVDGDDQLIKDAWINFSEIDYESISDLTLFSFNRLHLNGDLSLKRIREIKDNDGYELYDLLLNYLRAPNKDYVFTFCWGRVYKRNILNYVSFDEKLDNFEDLTFNVECFPFIKKIKSINEISYLYKENQPGKSLSINIKKTISRVLENNFFALNKIKHLIDNYEFSKKEKQILLNFLKHAKYAYISIIMSREIPLRIKNISDYFSLCKEFKIFFLKNNVALSSRSYNNKYGKGPMLPLLASRLNLPYLAVFLWLIKDIKINKFTRKY